MYYYLKEVKGYPVRIIGLDLKEDVICHCSDLAVRYGYEKLSFTCGDIASYEGVDHVDMVVTFMPVIWQRIMPGKGRWLGSEGDPFCSMLPA